MKFELRRPCANCPFRRDCLPGWLGRERAREIAEGLLVEQSTFACHKTTEAGGARAGREQQCAGALAVLDKAGRSPQLARIAERLGMPVAELDSAVGDLVFPNLEAFIDHHGDPDPEEGEPCSVAEMGCEAPAGYMVNGAAISAEVEEGLTAPCSACGSPVCESCSSEVGGERVCEFCVEQLENDDEEAKAA